MFFRPYRADLAASKWFLQKSIMGLSLSNTGLVFTVNLNLSKLIQSFPLGHLKLRKMKQKGSQSTFIFTTFKLIPESFHVISIQY